MTSNRSTLALGFGTLLALGALFAVGAIFSKIFHEDLDDDSHVVTLSTRTLVGIGVEAVHLAFVVKDMNQTMVVRVQGPSLRKFGIPNALPNPSFSIIRVGDQKVIASNDDWNVPANKNLLKLHRGLVPGNPLEAASLVRLAPGTYTIFVEGAPGNVGVALIEVYLVRN